MKQSAPGKSPTGPWLANLPRRPPLRGDQAADVVIVGGGYLGLNAALRLRETGRSVILLERDVCGRGASGRNAGHLTSTIGKDVYTCLRQWGPRKGLALAHLAQDAVASTEAIIRAREIDCDYRPVGNIIAGLHPRHRPLLLRAAETAGKAGLGMAFLGEAQMAERRLPRAFRFGIHEQHGGHLHPGKYLEGLRAAAIAAGVSLYEGSPVEALMVDRRVVAQTPLGRVAADDAIVATNAYLQPDLVGVSPVLLPLQVSLFRTAPLDVDQLARLGWPGREGVYTAHEILESYRLTADNRLVGGSKWVTLGDGAADVPGPTADLRRRFEGLIDARFPGLAPVIEDCWSGWIAATLDHLPIIGALHEGRVRYALGCNGHGIALATHLGQVLADEVVGRRRPDIHVLARWIPPIPTALLRRIAFHAVAAPLAAVDRRVDRELTGLGEHATR